MSTWELPRGYGRVKPDVMAYAKDVQVRRPARRRGRVCAGRGWGVLGFVPGRTRAWRPLHVAHAKDVQVRRQGGERGRVYVWCPRSAESPPPCVCLFG